MKTPLLLGIITALLFGSFAISGMMAQAGPSPFVMESVIGNGINSGSETLNCPTTHPFIISGTYDHTVRSNDAIIDSTNESFTIREFINTIDNSYTVSISSFGNPFAPEVSVLPIAYCANFNFPMNMGSMIGGELLDIDTMALFVGAIGVNPVITGLFAITMGGIAAQAVWFVHQRRKNDE